MVLRVEIEWKNHRMVVLKHMTLERIVFYFLE